MVDACFHLALSEHLLVLLLLGSGIQLGFFIRRVEGAVKFPGLHPLLVESLLVLEGGSDDTLDEFGFHLSHVLLAASNRIQELEVFITRRIFIGTVPESAFLLGFVLGTPLESRQLTLCHVRWRLIGNSNGTPAFAANCNAVFFFNASYEKSRLNLVLNESSLLLSGEGPYTGFQRPLGGQEVF